MHYDIQVKGQGQFICFVPQYMCFLLHILNCLLFKVLVHVQNQVIVIAPEHKMLRLQD